MNENNIPGVEIIPLRPHRDGRGGLLKVLMRHQLGGAERFGEIYLSWAEPGAVKAEHYHEKTCEWFCALRGEGILWLEEVNSGRQMRIEMNESAPITVRVPPGVAHAVQNVGEQRLDLLAYADRPYNPHDADTIPFHVTKSLATAEPLANRNRAEDKQNRL